VMLVLFFKVMTRRFTRGFIPSSVIIVFRVKFKSVSKVSSDTPESDMVLLHASPSCTSPVKVVSPASVICLLLHRSRVVKLVRDDRQPSVMVLLCLRLSRFMFVS
jgi:hypothetical protein